MKKIKNIIRFAAVAAVVSLSAACSSDDELIGDSTAIGTPVSFSGSTDKESTRVSYSNDGPVGSAASWPIEWDGTESKIYIYSPQATVSRKNDDKTYTAVKRYAMYTGTRVNSSDSTTTTNLAPNETSAWSDSKGECTGVCWGEDTPHTFYSLVLGNYSSTFNNIVKVDTSLASLPTGLQNKNDGSILKINFPATQTYALTQHDSIFYASDAAYPFIMYGTNNTKCKPNREEVKINYQNIATVFDINLKFTSSIEAQLQSSLTVTGIEAYIRSVNPDSNNKYQFRILGGDFYVDLEKGFDATAGTTPLVVVNNDNRAFHTGLTEGTSNASTLPTVAKVALGTSGVTLDTKTPSLNTKIFLPLTEKVKAASEIVIIGITISDHYTNQKGTYYLPLTLKKDITLGTIVPINLKYDATKDVFEVVTNSFVTSVGTDSSFFGFSDYFDDSTN